MMSLEFFLDTLEFLAVHLASFVAIVASAWIFGETILRRWMTAHWALAGTLGWGLIAQAMFVLGILGLFERGIVLGFLALGHLACFQTWRDVFQNRRRPKLPRVGYLVALPLLLLTLYPPIGFDATVYHLPYARAFVEAGQLQFLADLRFPVFPQVGEMGFVLGFFLNGDLVARASQVLATLLTAGLLLEWGRLYGPKVGIWASALWLGNPLIVWLGTSAYIDTTLALFVTASLYSWERWERDGERSWLVLAGIFVGMAASTKYLGLFFLAVLGLMTLIRSLKAREVRPLLTLGVVALAVLAPWYLRIFYHTGNPVFPFYAPLFGSSEWATLHDQALPTADAEEGALAVWSVMSRQGARVFEGLAFLLKVPWTAIFDREVFHLQPPLSPFYLLLLPVCAPIALFERWRRRLLIVVVAYGLFWLTTVRDLRFLVVIMPALNVAMFGVAASWFPGFVERVSGVVKARDLQRLATSLLTLLLLIPGPLYSVYKMHEFGWPPIGSEQRGEYLSEQVPGYSAIASMNRTGGDYTVYSLYGENLRYYAEGRFLGDWFGPARYSRIEAVLGSSERLAAELEQIGACFFLVRRPRARELLPRDGTFDQHFQQVMADENVALYLLPGVPCERNQLSGTLSLQSPP